MADRVVIDIGILQGVFGDLAKLQEQIGGIAPAVAGVDRAAGQAFGNFGQHAAGAQGAMSGLEQGVDLGMRNMVADIMAPLAKTHELESKLRSLGERVRTSRSVGEIVKLKKEIAATQKELDGVDTGAMERKVGGGVARMRNMFKGLASPIAGVFAVGAVTKFGGEVFKVAAKNQYFESSLMAITHSMEKVHEIQRDVAEFSKRATVLDTEEIMGVAKQFALQFDHKDIIHRMDAIGQAAAAVGADFASVSDLYSKIAGGRKVTSNEVDAMVSAGLPMWKALSDATGKTDAQVREMVKKGEVGFKQWAAAFNVMGGESGYFAGKWDQVAQTLDGKLGTLRSSFREFQSRIGELAAPLFFKGIDMMSRGLDILRRGFEWVVSNGDTIKDVLYGIAVGTAAYTALLLYNNAALIYNSALQAMAAVKTAALAAWTALTTGSVAGATAAQWSWNAALTANPIGAVIMLVVALVGAVIYAWNNFEEFRGFLYGLWASVKETFSGMWDIISGLFKGMVEVARTAAHVLDAVFSNPFKDGYLDGIKSAVGEHVNAIASLVSEVADVPNALADVANRSAVAAVKGFQEGVAALHEDNRDPLSSPGLDATHAGHGQDLGASGLVGGPSGPGSSAGDGVTVGDRGGSGRTINVDIKMTNNFNLPKDGNMGAREAAERIVGDLTRKFNDWQFAAG
ncbi:MAG: tape measure protein [Flavobacteriales bacterium]|nr:tape measure protein [Flavobacteriales bacterium]